MLLFFHDFAIAYCSAANVYDVTDVDVANRSAIASLWFSVQPTD